MPIITPAKLLQRNKKYAENHQAFPTMAEVVENGGVFETTLVLTCVDFRVNPDHFLQTKPEDQILVARSPAGRVDDSFVKEVMLFEAFLGLTSVLVIHHTDCGASHFKDANIRKFHKDRLPDHLEIDNMVFGAFDNLGQSVRDDIRFLKTSPYIPNKLADKCHGFIYDIKTGLLTPVEYDDSA
ncbi:carbonic anhydrase [Mollisia scopiformis]|uniref:Carbonic anhydrase n=1 Tax=Mollisia scopiformis TaxID=149040 RepID=A0A132BA16_MOLSC|nr:carbonic anhydrase [Mollisia scopiformis]KUJ08839.1 carbonic anhydrase [Mollisia scopiformis]